MGVPLFMFSLFALFVVAMIVFSLRAVKKRREELEALGRSMGLSFTPTDNMLLTSDFSDFQVFNSGHNRKLENCLSGAIQDLKVAVFQYRYDTGGSSPTTYHYAVACVWVPFPLPVFRLSPTNILHKIGNIFGYTDINFDSHPKFSRDYYLVGADEAAVRAAFSPAILEFAESQSKLHVEGNGSRLIVYRNGFLSAQNAQDLLTTAMRLAELFRV